VSELAKPPVSAEALGPADRRADRDRRSIPDVGRRIEPPDQWKRRVAVAARDLSIIVGAVCAIVFSVNRIHPIFANQPTVVQSLTKAVPAAKAALGASAPKDTGQIAAIVNSPKFEHDREAFASDLVKTGRMTQQRADSIAYYAVRESYLNAIPPAVVFGVMLTENAKFISGAMSNVGAVGLMQVYPKIWLKALKDKFGTDLASDSTNLKYGIYILKQYIKSSDSGTVKPKDVSQGLLRYNGCVHGSNTPNCQTYPAKVKTYVEKEADAMCGDKTFYDCIAKPFLAGLFGKSGQTTQ
jgi:soluble lytic murein transglycosylase-like protein